MNQLKLAWRIAVRDQRAAFKRTALGLLWLAITPLTLLAIYTLVFGVFLGVKWTQQGGGEIGYALPMFIGLAVYLVFSDLVTSSMNLLVSKRNLVLKTAFPVWVVLFSNFIRCFFSFSVSVLLIWLICLLMGLLSVKGFLYSLLPLLTSAVFLLGLSALFAMIGPFFGDLSQGVRLGMRVFFYASPVTYPMANVPEKYQFLLWLNPLTFMIEPFRNALLYQQPFIGERWAIFASLAACLVVAAFWVYRRIRGVLFDVV